MVGIRVAPQIAAPAIEPQAGVGLYPDPPFPGPGLHAGGCRRGSGPLLYHPQHPPHRGRNRTGKRPFRPPRATVSGSSGRGFYATACLLPTPRTQQMMAYCAPSGAADRPLPDNDLWNAEGYRLSGSVIFCHMAIVERDFCPWHGSPVRCFARIPLEAEGNLCHPGQVLAGS